MPVHNPRRIAATAASFVHAAELASAGAALVPEVVCRVFAVELYLKALLARQSIEGTGHDLCRLFAKVDADVAARLFDAVKCTRETFADRLTDVGSAFVEWRYAFEKDTLDIELDFVTDLARACAAECAAQLAQAGGQAGG